MAIDIDGFAVLGAIAKTPEVFPAVRTDAVKAARSLVVKQLKDRTLSVDQIKSVAASIGHESLDLILDALSDADIKTLLTKIDKYNADIRQASAFMQRNHLADLTRGVALPAAKAAPPPKAPKVPRPAKPKAERAGNSKSMSAVKKV